ncbi:MAG: hypothetical protein KIT14_18120 [bacterium]|nr:hypothetical protein [bacterium]
MPRSRTGTRAGEASRAVAVQVPLPLLAVLADAKTAFFGLCLTAGQQVFEAMMEHDRELLCGPKHVPNPARQAYRGGSVPSEVVLGGRRIVLPRLRARSVAGGAHVAELRLRQRRDPLVPTRSRRSPSASRRGEYRRTLDPLPAGVPAQAVSKSAVSRRFVALTRARVATWLAAPLDGLDIRVVLIDGLHFRGT